MAYNNESLTKLKALEALAQRVRQDYAPKTAVVELEEQVTATINAKVASTYRAGGSAAFSELPELTAANLGLVFNVTDDFTTTESFLEGAGAKHGAGTNVAVVQAGEDIRYDVLSGFVDLSGYMEKEDGKGLSANDYTDDEKAKLAGISVATDEEVAEMLETVFGGAE